MPEDDYAWLPRDTILTFEEMAELTAVFTELGVDKVRLTGGEPLLRRDLPRFVRQLSENRRITEIALTSNGVLMADQAADLSFAGLNRVTISLDTLRPGPISRVNESVTYTTKCSMASRPWCKPDFPP